MKQLKAGDLVTIGNEQYETVLGGKCSDCKCECTFELCSTIDCMTGGYHINKEPILLQTLEECEKVMRVSKKVAEEFGGTESTFYFRCTPETSKELSKKYDVEKVTEYLYCVINNID
jgi:hypothetical protein